MGHMHPAEIDNYIRGLGRNSRWTPIPTTGIDALHHREAVIERQVELHTPDGSTRRHKMTLEKGTVAVKSAGTGDGTMIISPYYRAVYDYIKENGGARNGAVIEISNITSDSPLPGENMQATITTFKQRNTPNSPDFLDETVQYIFSDNGSVKYIDPQFAASPTAPEAKIYDAAMANQASQNAFLERLRREVMPGEITDRLNIAGTLVALINAITNLKPDSEDINPVTLLQFISGPSTPPHQEPSGPRIPPPSNTPWLN